VPVVRTPRAALPGPGPRGSRSAADHRGGVAIGHRCARVDRLAPRTTDGPHDVRPVGCSAAGL